MFLFRLGFFIFLYSGLMAGFLLIYSIIWKRFKHSDDYSSVLHIIALFIAAIVSIIFFRPNFLAILTIVFLISSLLAYHNRNKQNKKEGIKQLHIIYILLFLTWIANAAAHFFIRISLKAGIILYTVSSILFLTIACKVAKSTGMKK